MTTEDKKFSWIYRKLNTRKKGGQKMKIGIFWGRVLLCYVETLEQGMAKMEVLRERYKSLELRQLN